MRRPTTGSAINNIRRPSLFSKAVKAVSNIALKYSPDDNQKNDYQRPRDNVIVAKSAPPAPTVYEIPIGVRLDGEIAKMKLYEKHTLIAGASGSGKSYLANRVLAQIVQIPQEQRIIVGIDLKQSEIAKWHGGGCLDAAAINYEYAALLLGNVRAEMDRRNNLIFNNPQVYRDSKIHPSEKFPLIVVYIDELAMLGLPQRGASKEEEELRRVAYDHFSKLLFLARSAGIIVIACIQRSDASIIDGFTKQNLQQVVAGRVATRTDAEVIFGRDIAEEAPAWKLENKWFYANFEGSAPFMFKSVGEKGDADLWRVIEDPATTIPEDRGKWLYDPMYGKGKGSTTRKTESPEQPAENNGPEKICSNDAPATPGNTADASPDDITPPPRTKSKPQTTEKAEADKPKKTKKAKQKTEDKADGNAKNDGFFDDAFFDFGL